MPTSSLSPVKSKLLRVGELRQERATWIARYREISQYLLPYSGRFFPQDRNRGDKSFNSIYDSTATRAARILAAGLMAGVTSPARPWFRLATPDPDLNKATAVKQWLADVAQLMRDIFAKSNTYRSLHSQYEELGAFGTAASIIDDNYDTVVWHTPLTAGEYMIATDDLGRVNRLAREYEMTVSQMVEKFGIAKCSPTVQSMYTSNRLSSWIPITHVVEPRGIGERDFHSPLAKDMAWASYYIEAGANNDNYLRESGYPDFPVLPPRWNVRGGDVYGHGPAFEALCDVKGLQQEQLRKSQAIDYQTKPPLQMPTALKGQGKGTLPGGVVYFDQVGSGNAIKSLFDVRLDLGALREDIIEVQHRIDRAFYVDLFLMLADMDSRQPVTATEIAERKEEKLLMLGPVLERLHDELLSPMIDTTFAKMVRSGILPPPPPEMHGVELTVQFISVLAQAQRAVGLGSMDRLLGTVASMAQFRPEVLDKIDTDEVVDRYSDMLGVDPAIIVADDKVALIRNQRAKQAEAAQAAANAQVAAETASKLGSIDTSKPNAATDLMAGLTGYN